MTIVCNNTNFSKSHKTDVIPFATKPVSYFLNPDLKILPFFSSVEMVEYLYSYYNKPVSK